MSGIEFVQTAHIPRILDREQYEAMTIPEAAAELKDLKAKLEEFGAIKTSIQKAYDLLSIEILPDMMDDEGIQTMKIVGVGRLQASSDIRCSVLAKNRAALEEWLQESGNGSMVSTTINASTLKAFIKERMKENKFYPAELLSITPFTRATVVKG